jgi:hypothetical protein
MELVVAPVKLSHCQQDGPAVALSTVFDPPVVGSFPPNFAEAF